MCEMPRLSRLIVWSGKKNDVKEVLECNNALNMDAVR
jgi:hypothetical protein